MQNVKLYFKGIKVGTLYFDGDKYYYDSDDEGEKKASEDFGFLAYDLVGSKMVESDELFDFFNFEFEDVFAGRPDIRAEAGILSDDGKFTILKKLALIDLSDDKYEVREN